MHLKPGERLILLSLRIQPKQTRAGLAESTGIRHPHRLVEAIRLLIIAGLVLDDASVTPTTYRLAEASRG